MKNYEVPEGETILKTETSQFRLVYYDVSWVKSEREAVAGFKNFCVDNGKDVIECDEEILRALYFVGLDKYQEAYDLIF